MSFLVIFLMAWTVPPSFVEIVPKLRVGYLRPDQFLDHLTVIKNEFKGQGQKQAFKTKFRKFLTPSLTSSIIIIKDIKFEILTVIPIFYNR